MSAKHTGHKPGKPAPSAKRKHNEDTVDKSTKSSQASIRHKKAKLDEPVKSAHAPNKATGISKGAKKNTALIQEITQKWEKLRHPEIASKERTQVVREILDMVQGRVPDLAMSHTASRVIQACAKHGTDADRQMILAEATPRVVDLAKSSYGHFLLCKLITAAPKKDFPGILKMFKGHIAHMLRHPCAAAVVDDLYTQANAQQRSAMVAELYGREYVLFSAETKRLPELFKHITPAQQRTVLRHIGQHAVPIMEKALIDPAIVHRILAEYVTASPGVSVAEAVQLLSGPPLLRMVHTREGAQLACDVISYGSAKDRKKAVKAMTGQVMKMALDEWAHVVLICVLDKVDDTALLKKSILPELQGGLPELCKHKYGRRVLLQLLRPNAQKYVPMNVQKMCQSPAKPASGFEVAADQEEETPMLGGSKKDSKLRRAEVLGSGDSSLAHHLCQHCAQNAADMLRDPLACDTVVELAQAGADDILLLDHGSEVEEVQNAIASAAASQQPSAGSEGGEEHILLNYHSSRAVRRLILDTSKASASTVNQFSSKLWQSAFQGKCKQWLGTHAEKLLVALASIEASTFHKALNAELHPLVQKDALQWAQAFVHRSKVSPAL